MREEQHIIRIYHKDTDALGIVHHTNYFVYFEQARTEILRSLGIELPLLLEQHQIQFVVAKIEIKYSKPAKLDDVLIIYTSIKELNKCSVIFMQRACNQEHALLCSAEIKLAIVDQFAKLAILPEKLRLDLMR